MPSKPEINSRLSILKELWKYIGHFVCLPFSRTSCGWILMKVSEEVCYESERRGLDSWEGPRKLVVLDFFPVFTPRAMLSAVLLQSCRRRPPPSGFCDPMRLGDFIDFISVDRRRTRCQHSCSRRHTVYLSAMTRSRRDDCQRRGSQSH